MKATIKQMITTVGVALTLTSATQASDNKAPHWTYEGKHGPEHWGQLSHEWEKCEKGTQQSPVDLKWHQPKSSRKIDPQYSLASFDVVDNGHTIQANFDKGNYVFIEGQKYELLQLHFHAKSEHSIGKKFYPLEMHLVHADKNGKLAVVGVMFEEGAENSELNKIFNTIPSQKNHKEKSKAKLNFQALLPTQKTHYHYSGSLTTPPCSEGVNWNVFNTPLTASPEQIARFTKLYSNNARPLQDLHGRMPANF